MRLLIDTNVFISAGPTRSTEIETTTKLANTLILLANRSGELLVHPLMRNEIEKDADVDRRLVRLHHFGRFEQLTFPPDISVQMESILGTPLRGSNDWYDNCYLAAVVGNAVWGLVSNDQGLHRKAMLLDIANRVMTIQDAVETLSALEDEPVFVPDVQVVPVHALDFRDSFFDSLRRDYLGFDNWIARIQPTGRTAAVIRNEEHEIAGLAILKRDDDDYGIGGNCTKICTLKVAEESRGNRYGELLLKHLFLDASKNHVDALWLTVFPRHDSLIDLLEQFGFSEHAQTNLGEAVYAKSLKSKATASEGGLDFHVRYGPPAIDPLSSEMFVVPIQPEFYQLLFPDSSEIARKQAARPPLWIDKQQAFGNSLRKVYLSRSPSRLLLPGSVLLFYRSHDWKAVEAVGVVEDTAAFEEAEKVISFAGSRTVYTSAQVEVMSQGGTILAILFRQDRFLERMMTLQELTEHHVLAGAPQSITRVLTGSESWLIERITE